LAIWQKPPIKFEYYKRKNILNIKFRFHALSRMFERKISETDVLEVLATGKVIENYPTDQPYPSRLKLGFVKNRSLHVVTAEATDEATTVYNNSIRT
jgi:hypothetical protein